MPSTPALSATEEATRVGAAPDPAEPAGPSTPRSVRTVPLAAVREPTRVGIAPVTELARRCSSCGELYPSDFLVCPRDATPLVDAEETIGLDPLIGVLLGETYQIVRTIGEGGMGRVYEARHLRLKERRFAVKALHADLAKNPEMAARFLREASIASSIKHENVVDVFDVHHLADGTPYLVGEYLEGEELADYVTKRGPLEPRLAAKVGRQVCQALAAAHERDVIHRDMKPENIFVLAASIAEVDSGSARTLQVKVIDFGISKAGTSDALTRTGVIMGTPSYMSPEQARGKQVDSRADIYALGACLYFMVTGRRPFEGDDPTSTLALVLSEDPVRLREVDPRIPETLELVIQHAMAKEAEDRYPSMLDLDKALAGFLGQSALPSNHGLPSSHAMDGSTAIDVAHAMLGVNEAHASAGAPTDARTARPTIILASGALGGWLFGATVTALAGLVRVLHDGEITLTESLLLVIGCIVAAATPAALYVMHLQKVVWPNSVRATQLASDLKRTSVAALVGYGSLSLLGRGMHTVVMRSSHGLASGVWDIALLAISVTGAVSIGGAAPLLRSLRRRR